MSRPPGGAELGPGGSAGKPPRCPVQLPGDAGGPRCWPHGTHVRCRCTPGSSAAPPFLLTPPPASRPSLRERLSEGGFAQRPLGLLPGPARVLGEAPEEAGVGPQRHVTLETGSGRGHAREVSGDQGGRPGERDGGEAGNDTTGGRHVCLGRDGDIRGRLQLPRGLPRASPSHTRTTERDVDPRSVCVVGGAAADPESGPGSVGPPVTTVKETLSVTCWRGGLGTDPG